MVNDIYTQPDNLSYKGSTSIHAVSAKQIEIKISCRA